MRSVHQILNLPESCIVNKKITKAFFKRNFDLTLSERKLLEDAAIIQQIDWIASIKPQNSNIAAYSDELSIYEEIQVISLNIGDEAISKHANRVMAFVQKYIPYHILLILKSNDSIIFNTAEKRINQNETSKRTIEKSMSTELIIAGNESAAQLAFLNNCAFEQLDKSNLKTLYHSWTGCIAALMASNLTGEYQTRPVERVEADIRLLEEIGRIEKEVKLLSSQAQKETQLNLQIQINTEVQAKRKQLEQLKAHLK